MNENIVNLKQAIELSKERRCPVVSAETEYYHVKDGGWADMPYFTGIQLLTYAQFLKWANDIIEKDGCIYRSIEWKDWKYVERSGVTGLHIYGLRLVAVNTDGRKCVATLKFLPNDLIDGINYTAKK